MRIVTFITLVLVLAPLAVRADETVAALKVDDEVLTNASAKTAYLAYAGPVRADETLAVLKAGSETYSNVTVTTVSATDVYFTFSGGMANVKIKDLSPDLQQHFNFDPKKAKAVELQQAQDKIKYHEELLHQPQAPDMSRDSSSAPPAGPALWQRNLAALLGQAQAQNKLVLLDFTGSDWEPWCIKSDQEVLETDKFAAYANQKLLLVKVDFLRKTQQPEDLKQANTALANQFKVNSLPTYVLLDSLGRELGRQVGYQPGGPDAFITELDGFSRR